MSRTINSYVNVKTESSRDFISIPDYETAEEGRQRILEAIERSTGVPIIVLENPPYMNYISTLYGMFEKIVYLQILTTKTELSSIEDPRYEYSPYIYPDDINVREWAKRVVLKVDSKSKNPEVITRQTYLPPYSTPTCPSGVKTADGDEDLGNNTNGSTVVGDGIFLGTTTKIQYLGLLTNVIAEDVMYEPDPSLSGGGYVYPYAEVGEFSVGEGECAPNQSPEEWSEVQPTDFLFPIQDYFSVKVKVANLISYGEYGEILPDPPISTWNVIYNSFTPSIIYELENPVLDIENIWGNHNENGEFSWLSATKINSKSYLIGMHDIGLLKSSGNSVEILDSGILYNYRLRKLRDISKARR